MNKYSKIADALAGFLTFEQWSGRSEFFNESYLAYPLAQILNAQYPNRVLPEIVHPVLSQHKKTRGDFKRTDFVITGRDNGSHDLAIETKWISKSTTLLRDLIRDVVRLDLLMPDYAKEAILILAGNVKAANALFEDKRITTPSDTPKPALVSPTGPRERSGVYFHYRITDEMKSFLSTVLDPFPPVDVSSVIQLHRSGPFPHGATTRHTAVYIWRVMPRGKKFNAARYAS